MIIIPIANKADAIIARIRIGIGIEISLGIKKELFQLLLMQFLLLMMPFKFI
jgi:hypothetical protein